MKISKSIVIHRLSMSFVLVLLSLMAFGQICDFHGKVLEIEGEPTIDLFDASSSLEYVDQTLYINQEVIAVDDVEETNFDSKAELEQILGCSFFVGKDFNSTINGHIVGFDLDTDTNGDNLHQLDYITFDDYGRDFKFVLVNKTFLFEFVNSVSFVWQPAMYYERSQENATDFEYVDISEIDGDFQITKEAIFETVTEQVLVSDAYSILTIVPSGFEVEYHTYYNETSTCADAIIEEVILDFVIKENHTALEVNDAEFDVVTELRLDVHAYSGPGFYKREVINLDTLKNVFIVQLEIESLKEDCYNLNFINCSNYIEIKDSIAETSDLGLGYEPCNAPFKSAGEYCYHEDVDVPATYKQRSYTKLIMPASTSSQNVNAEYTTLTVTRVVNKDELEESCIDVSYDSIAYEKLVNPATVEVQEVPAEYATVESKLIKEYPEFVAVESDEEAIIVMTEEVESITKIDNHLKLQTVDLTCIHDAIRSELIALAYANSDISILSKEYFQAIIDFQQDHDIPIGAIDENLLESLNISFE